jgi:hypothetical protein
MNEACTVGGPAARRDGVTFRSEMGDFRMKDQECDTVTPTRSGRKTVLLHFSPERDSTDLQRLGGFTTVAGEAFERTLDHDLLLLLEIERVITRTGARLLRDFRGQVADADVRIIGEDDRAFPAML